MEGGGDASVDGLREDVTDGLLHLEVDFLVKIVIRVMYAGFLLSCAGAFGVELIIDLTCLSAEDWFAVALIKVPVLIHSSVVAGSLSVLGEVVQSLLAGLIDFVSLVGEGTSHVPVLSLVDTGGRV